MNERIDKLFGQALDKAVPETWTTLDADQLSRLKEKFAQLIVGECIEVLNKRFMGDHNREDQEVRQCIKDLKNHFEVEDE